MRGRSLAFQLTVYLGTAWLVLFLVLGGLVWQSAQQLIQKAESDKARALAAQLATVSLDAVLLRDYGTLERYLVDLAGAVAYAEIRRADGQVLGRTGQRIAGLELLRVPMRAADEEIGEVLAQYDPRPARQAAWQLAGLFALTLAQFATLTFLALRRLLLARLLAPVAALIEQADPEKPPSAPPTGAPAEVVELAAAIAGLRERIARHLAEADEAAQTRNEAIRRLCSEQRLSAVGQLAGEVAHELNTPLSNILGYAQSARPRATDAEVRESLTTIENQARRAGQIVRDMLTSARAPAPVMQRIDLADLIASFMRLIGPLARRQDIFIEARGESSVAALADPSRIEQILFNLVGNAWQAGAGAVRLSFGTAPDGHPFLDVTDNGPGLPASVRARIFEPFVTTKPAGQGTGLGLVISQRLAREMGGELEWLETLCGACFQLNLRAAEDVKP